ncbi:hypothetical protein DKX38_022171 [Salix brachista]|uniref:F-box/LRR-repeat protein 15-like leucin rich repeat domain-containing protein n=1 Tax=Salix brachista TaxID=2182728 RepID=A0A5N5JZI6_9ROSI|nr:hypothetical protein DKX38_022171 [Salix brachista]
MKERLALCIPPYRSVVKASLHLVLLKLSSRLESNLLVLSTLQENSSFTVVGSCDQVFSKRLYVEDRKVIVTLQQDRNREYACDKEGGQSLYDHYSHQLEFIKETFAYSRDFDEKVWTRIKELKDQAIFIGSSGEQVLACSTEKSRIHGNKIYLTLAEERSLYVYDLDLCALEIDLSNGVELNDLAAAAIAEAKNLEKLWLSRCKLITDMGIGCVAVGCRKLRLICLKWCLKVSDLGLQLLALKCKEIRSLDLSYLQITEKCLPSILQLQHLEDLVLEGCLGIDDNALSTLQQSCKSLKTLNMSNCHNHSHVGLSSLINGAENLRELTLAYGPAITEYLAKCLHTFSGLRSVKSDGCLVKCSGVRAIGRWPRSLKELSFSKCSGVEDDSLSFLVRAHKELTKLDITCCRKITYDSVDSITSSCRSLTSVRMESCSLVPKEAFVLFGQRCELIEEFDVTDSKIDDEGLKSISRCSKLSSLKLGICLNITDDGLKHIGSRCSKLKELDLYRFCLKFQCLHSSSTMFKP